MARLVDWWDRFEAVIDHYAAGAYAPGRLDCLTFGLDVVEALTGATIFSDQRGYASRAEAAARGMALGFAGMGDGFASVLTEIPPVRAARGDLAVVPTVDGEACMVFVEAELLGMGPGGLWRVPRGEAVRAFKVG